MSNTQNVDIQAGQLLESIWQMADLSLLWQSAVALVFIWVIGLWLRTQYDKLVKRISRLRADTRDQVSPLVADRAFCQTLGEGRRLERLNSGVQIIATVLMAIGLIAGAWFFVQLVTTIGQ